MEKVLREV